MINREIFYERNLTGSYMKIPVSPNPGFDEKIMLKRKLPGILPVEKCFVNGAGQYWYNISGKQSLDMFCRMKDIGIEFIERMVVSICNEVEILEWNLMDTNCLVLDPEMIFVSNQSKELIFTVYPGDSTPVTTEFQQLMEYMLTKIDHKDERAVKAAYSIYEKSLDDGYSIMDIRSLIMEKKETKCDVQKAEKIPRKEEKNVDKCITMCKSEKKVPEKKSFLDRLLEFLGINVDKKPEKSNWVEAEPEYEEPVIISNPTVCLSDYGNHPKGKLLYKGDDGFEDITLKDDITKIGQGDEMDACIKRGTISHYHAKIEGQGADYYIEDLNSTNGTTVNGEALPYKERRRLQVDDIVQLADVAYRFV